MNRIPHLTHCVRSIKLLGLMGAFIAVSIVFAASTRAWFSYSNDNIRQPDAAPIARPETGRDAGIEVEVITATPRGFEPAEITRPRGAFILAVHNRSGHPALELKLDRVQGGREREVHLRRGRRRAHERLDLPPGEYILTDINQPVRTCRITLTN